MAQSRSSEDLIVGLCFEGNSVLYVKTEKTMYFPSIKLSHDTSDNIKTEQLKKYFHDTLGLNVKSTELIGHIQKDPRDILQYFLDSHIFLYKVIISPDQTIKQLSSIEIGFHDLNAGQVEGFSYKGRLLLDFLKDWKILDFKRIDSKDIWEWYTKWKNSHINKAYKEYINEEIDECRGEADCFTQEIDSMLIQNESEKEYTLDRTVDDVFKESQELAILIAQTEENIVTGNPSPEASENPDATLQLSALNEIKNHLCNKIYGLKNSHLNEVERRIAYRLLGHLLKRTNDLIDKYQASGAKHEYDLELKKLVYELESENLSPFVTR